MRSLLALPFLFLACLWLQPVPVRAQDDDPGFETGDGEGGEPVDDDEAKVRKKNVGLAGQGEGDDGDPDAPKVKADLQTRINQAIEAGVKWLKDAQDKEGSWGPVKANKVYGSEETGDFTRDPTGPTSFAIYTLAKCGVKSSDPAIRKGLKWLDHTKVAFDVLGKKEIRGDETAILTTYESASIVLMLEVLNERSAKLTGRQARRRIYTDNPLKPPSKSRFDKDDWMWLHDRILYLTKGRTIGGGGARGKGSTTTIPGAQNPNGGWRYGQANGDQDLSATQFCLLALRAASQAGYPIDKVAPETFRWAAEFCKSVQAADGAFSYQRGNATSAGMDACGIGSLLICKEQMELMEQEVPPWIDDAIKRGLEHLDSVFDATQNKGWHEGGANHYYYLYAVERVGDLTGRKEFGGKDWYVRGAEFLLAHQDADGKWVDPSSFPPRDVLGTCFALLFLKRATPPVVTMRREGE